MSLRLRRPAPAQRAHQAEHEILVILREHAEKPRRLDAGGRKALTVANKLRHRHAEGLRERADGSERRVPLGLSLQEPKVVRRQAGLRGQGLDGPAFLLPLLPNHLSERHGR